MTEQARLTCSPLGKAFEKQRKTIKKQTETIEDQGEKQIKKNSQTQIKH